MTSAITKTAFKEPWPSILLTTQRTQLLQDLLELETLERQAISERLHDGALQYVLVARQDVEYVREGSGEAIERIDEALIECSSLLRDVVRELHPEVLARSGLKTALETLASSIGARDGLSVEVDARTWPDVDHVLYGTAREALTNVVKHARAHNVWLDLVLTGGRATLRIADDGVGVSDARLAKSLEEGHIGIASTRTKVLAAEGLFDIRATSPGTEITVCVHVAPTETSTVTRSRF